MKFSTAIELEQGETIVLYLRPFWFVLFGALLAGVLLFIIPIVAVAIFWNIVQTWFAQPLLGPILTLLAAIYIAMVWLYMFGEFVQYYLDTWVVTSMRIIDADQLGLFRRTVSELHLANIQDVTTNVKGLFPTMFNFGDLKVQTAGEQDHFNFSNAPRPEHVKEIIMKLVEVEKERYRTLPGQPGSPV